MHLAFETRSGRVFHSTRCWCKVTRFFKKDLADSTLAMYLWTVNPSADPVGCWLAEEE